MEGHFLPQDTGLCEFTCVHCLEQLWGPACGMYPQQYLLPPLSRETRKLPLSFTPLFGVPVHMTEQTLTGKCMHFYA